MTTLKGSAQGIKAARFDVKKCYKHIIPQAAALNFRGAPWYIAVGGKGEHVYTVAEGSSVEAIHASLRDMHKHGLI